MSDELIPVYRAANMLEGHLLKGMLEQGGIRVHLCGESLTSGVGELPVNVAEVDLHVPRQDAAIARRYLEAYEARGLNLSAQLHWTCRSCQEANPDAFDICWNCQRERCAE